MLMRRLHPQLRSGEAEIVDDEAHQPRPHGSPALRVLAAEALEPLIERAVTARADYLQAVAGLAWLLRNGAMPDGDVRARQLVAGADTPPSRWPEASRTDGGMAERLAALMEGDHP
jgi:hypothetical protein